MYLETLCFQENSIRQTFIPSNFLRSFRFYFYEVLISKTSSIQFLIEKKDLFWNIEIFMLCFSSNWISTDNKKVNILNLKSKCYNLCKIWLVILICITSTLTVLHDVLFCCKHVVYVCVVMTKYSSISKYIRWKA